jgi:hypothetical protein
MNTFIKYGIKLFFLAILSSTSHYLFAAPTLSTLDASATEVVINGSNFGEGPKVVLFDNFEHGRKFADLLQNQGNKNNWFKGVLPLKEADGNIAHRAKDPAQVALGKKGLAQVISEFPQAYQTALVAFSVKVPAGTTFAGASTPKSFPAISSWKFSWLMLGENGFQEPDKFDVCLPQHPGGGNFTFIGNKGNLTWLEHANSWWEWDNYNHMTSYVKISEVNSNNTPIKFSFQVINNLKHHTQAGDNLKFMSVSYQKSNFTFDRVNIPGWWGNGDNTKFDGLYDNMYAAVGDNALARVIVTDSPVFEKSKFAIPVMAKSWIDNKIILDTDVLPNKTVYLHVVDSLGVRSSGSLEFICKKCPKPPIAL